MTQKLSELFNLPPAEEVTAEEAEHTIEENREMIEAVDTAIDKIDQALPFVNDLDTSDKELDEHQAHCWVMLSQPSKPN